MSRQSVTTRFLSRNIDYLGELGAKLRDLQGYATLAFELIQNADDAPAAHSMRFDVRDEALVVENDGLFTDCGQVEADECPWKQDPSLNRRCDFHRFQLVASGDKRDEAGTIGAFGIGFISVYQITDRPELISAGRHWIVHEDRQENERIEQCPGCEKCGAPDLKGTRFILPWASDPNSILRTKLRASAVDTKDRDNLLETVRQNLPTAMLFLKKLETLQVMRNGKKVKEFKRLLDGDSLILNDGTSDHIWHLVRGEFTAKASEMRRRHGHRIEDKRSDKVTLAIPGDPIAKAVFCAFLPSESETGMPLHINADFFTTTDRKRLILASDYQSEWNRAAIEAAADAFAGSLSRLSTLLKHDRLWELIESVNRVALDVKEQRREATLAQFWTRLLPEVRRSRVVFTTCKEWRLPAEAVFLLEKQEEDAVPVLEGLGLSVVHGDLRKYQNLLISRDVGVELLNVAHLAKALTSAGLTARTPTSALPQYLRSEAARKRLWNLLGRLLNRVQRAEERARLSGCAIAPGRDGALWPCSEIYWADNNTVKLFAEIAPEIPFLANVGAETEILKAVCPEFTAANAVTHLRTLLTNAEINLEPAPLIHWFETRGEEIIGDSRLRTDLAALPIFPCSGGLKPLTTLALPGDFIDPLGLAGIVDLSSLGGRREFLRDLGATELTFERYAAEHLPRAFRNETVSADRKRKAIRLLADHVGEIRDEQEIRQGLARSPIVECTDGCFRPSVEVYFGSKDVTDILGQSVPVAKLPKDHHDGVRELYTWLGVAGLPRFSDITQRVRELSRVPRAPDSVAVSQSIFAHLARRLREGTYGEESLAELQRLAWLPARGDESRWYRPNELYAVFQDYLFETQATFLDVPREVQAQSRELLDFLGIETTPSAQQVVRHLLHCAEQRVQVNKEVYRFLNDKAADSALKALKVKACLLLPDNTYVKPSEVFWGEHPFGRYRHQLGPDLRRYSELFAHLGVREVPDHDDALNVLKEIANEFGTGNRPLDETAYSVLIACWEKLEQALTHEKIDTEAIRPTWVSKVVPDVRRVLNVPEHIFFEDRPGLAAKFKGVIDYNVITRPHGAWRAMEAAGVRALATAVCSHLVECTDPTDDELVTSRVRERRVQLARVLEAQDSEQSISDLSILDALAFQAVNELTIQYSLKAFNRDLTSDPESVPAHFHRDAGVVYFVRRNGTPPWAPLARELALALCPQGEPGRLASGIKEVLAAETDQDATAVLNDLGFPTLDIPATEAVAEPAVIQDLGGETIPASESWTEPPKAASEAVPSVPQPGAAVPSQAASSQNEVEQDESMTADEAVGKMLGAGAGAPAPMSDELNKILRDEIARGRPDQRRPAGRREDDDGKRQYADRKGDERGTRRERRDGDKRSTRYRGGSKLRTYVTPEVEDDGEPDSELATERNAVKQAGVNRVVEHERRCGRDPEEMPPMNPGYDVRSKDSAGTVVRFIEVKSLSGDWVSQGAALTETQFRMATEKGERYWLYVVERAERDDHRIIRIQDPARRVNQFIYDDGWQALAEQDEEPATDAVTVAKRQD